MTILTPVKARDWAIFALQAQLLRFNALNVAQKQGGLNAGFQQKVNSINLDADKWLDIQEDIKDAVVFLDKVVKRLETIRGHLDDMLSTAFKARDGDTHSAWTYPIKFDVSLRGLIATAEDQGGNPNLLGSAQHRSFTYKSNDIGETETVSRSFLGSDYYITDSTGKIWTRDRSSFLLRQRDATTGAKTGEFAALTGGLRLDSLSGSAITFTTAPDTTDSTTYTGTLSTSGLDVLDAWLYGNLESSADRQRAEDDLHSAKNTVDLHLARLRSALATARFYESQSNVKLSAFSDLIDDKTTAHLLELQEVEDGNAQRNSLNTLIINAHRANSALYKKMFSGTPADALSQTRINLLV